jgi:adenylosuccinate lyase
MGAFRGEGDFLTLLGADSDVASRLSPSELEGCFDLEHALRYAELLVERATRA